MKGICFIEPLFHKVAKREKTQTRRMITPEPKIQNGWIVKPKSKYKVGEIVYLKEPYVDDLIMGKTLYKYSKSDLQELISNGYGDMVNSKGFWKNKLFMPESAARYFIKITAVRAERLQDISDKDCLKEGIFEVMGGALNMNGIDDIGWLQPNDAYASLIDKINGKGTWDKDPWVWVYDFELINN